MPSEHSHFSCFSKNGKKKESIQPSFLVMYFLIMLFRVESCSKTVFTVS